MPATLIMRRDAKRKCDKGGTARSPLFHLEPLALSKVPFAPVTSENRAAGQRTRLAVVKCLCGVPAFSIDAYDRHLPKQRIQYIHA